MNKKSGVIIPVTRNSNKKEILLNIEKLKDRFVICIVIGSNNFDLNFFKELESDNPSLYVLQSHYKFNVKNQLIKFGIRFLYHSKVVSNILVVKNIMNLNIQKLMNLDDTLTNNEKLKIVIRNTNNKRMKSPRSAITTFLFRKNYKYLYPNFYGFNIEYSPFFIKSFFLGKFNINLLYINLRLRMSKLELMSSIY
jgi:hypothetical protein